MTGTALSVIAGDQYVGLDRFGRAVGWQWHETVGDPSAPVYFTYTYDRNSNRMGRADQSNSQYSETYAYDGLNQLTSFSRPGASETWTFDPAGNFPTVNGSNGTENRTHNKQNQLTAIDSQQFQYDGNGNMASDGVYTYTYDAWNRLVEIVSVVNQVEVGPEYGYDALGRRIVEGRIEPIEYDDVDLYYNDAWQVIHERHPGPSPRSGEPPAYWDEFNIYFWSAVSIDTMLARFRDIDQDPYYEYEDRVYPMQDAQGNVSALAVAGGSMIERATQTPYGVQTVRHPLTYAPVPVTTNEWRYFHQGLRLDVSGEFYDNRARMYSPHWMRFIQNDPIGLQPDPNMYRYVGNGPVSRSDPSGLFYSVVLQAVMQRDVPTGINTQRFAYTGGSGGSGGMGLYPSSQSKSSGASGHQASGAWWTGGEGSGARPPSIQPSAKNAAATSLSLPVDSGATWPSMRAVSDEEILWGRALRIENRHYDWHDPSTGYRDDDGLAFRSFMGVLRGLDFFAMTFSGLAVPGGGRPRTSEAAGPTSRKSVPLSVHRWPGYDSRIEPPGTEWRGRLGSQPGGGQGNYVNPFTNEWYRPDLRHDDPIGPHWDYAAPNGRQYRIYPDGTIRPK